MGQLLQSHLIYTGFCLSVRTQTGARPKTALPDLYLQRLFLLSPPRHLPPAPPLASEILNNTLPLVCLSKACEPVIMRAVRILSEEIHPLFVRRAWLSVCREPFLTAFV